MKQQAQEIDVHVIDEVRDFLFDDGCLDLVSLNIQRGRDHGILKYNDLREELGLARAATFADISSVGTTQTNLASAYASVDEVDAWTGGLAEDHVNAGLVGELFSHILVDQFIRLRDGDPFWFDRDPDVTDSRVQNFFDITETTLGKVIADNTIHTGASNTAMFVY